MLQGSIGQEEGQEKTGFKALSGTLQGQITALSPGLFGPPQRPRSSQKAQKPCSWGRGQELRCAASFALPGQSRPSGTQASAPKFEEGTVTTVTTFCPKPGCPLPLVNFSRELTRHFRAASTRGRGEDESTRALPGRKWARRLTHFPRPPLACRSPMRGGGPGLRGRKHLKRRG